MVSHGVLLPTLRKLYSWGSANSEIRDRETVLPAKFPCAMKSCINYSLAKRDKAAVVPFQSLSARNGIVGSYSLCLGAPSADRPAMECFWRVIGTHVLMGDDFRPNGATRFPFPLGVSTRPHGMLPDHLLRVKSLEVGDALPFIALLNARAARPCCHTVALHSQQHRRMRL